MKPEEKLALLHQALAHARSSPFYRYRLPKAPLRSLADLEQVPLTTKEDLRRESPFGLVCTARQDLCQYHESIGTTGTPVSAWYTEEDLRDNAVSAIAHIMHAAAQIKGACVVPVSARTNVSPYPRVVDLLRKLEATVLACLPQQALLIAETAGLLGLAPGRDLPALRGICTAGEPLPPGLRGLLTETWGVPVFDNYGLTECGVVAADCEFGRCHLVEDAFYPEILCDDLATAALPGETGWLVLTTLKRRAMPLVRYLVGDRAAMIDADCPCGRRTVLLIRGRAESRIAIGERVLDTWDLDEIVSSLPSRRFWAAGPAGGGLRLVVEDEGSGQLTPEFIEGLESRFNLRLHLEIVPPGTLCDRSELLAVSPVGKPRYTYTAEEMEAGVYLSSARP